MAVSLASGSMFFLEPQLGLRASETLVQPGDDLTLEVGGLPFSAVGMYPEKQLDHIFSHWPKAHGAGHPVAAAIVGDAPVDGVWASDHFGVMADLRY